MEERPAAAPNPRTAAGRPGISLHLPGARAPRHDAVDVSRKRILIRPLPSSNLDDLGNEDLNRPRRRSSQLLGFGRPCITMRDGPFLDVRSWLFAAVGAGSLDHAALRAVHSPIGAGRRTRGATRAPSSPPTQATPRQRPADTKPELCHADDTNLEPGHEIPIPTWDPTVSVGIHWSCHRAGTLTCWFSSAWYHRRLTKLSNSSGMRTRDSAESWSPGAVAANRIGSIRRRPHRVYRDIL